MRITRLPDVALTLMMLLIFEAGSVLAVAPSKETVKQWQTQGLLATQIANWQQFKKAGACAPSEVSIFDRSRQTSLAAGAGHDSLRILVVMVDFPDHLYNTVAHGQAVNGEPYQFDSILFSDRTVDAVFNPSGSLTDYFLEVSYNQLKVTGEVHGWYTMPNDYTYYVGADNGQTLGPVLARHAAEAAKNAGIDFSQYDYDSNDTLDALLVIHAGPGRESFANLNEPAIWSHKWKLLSPVVSNGVTVKEYIITPEEYDTPASSEIVLAPIGVVCHEFGHMLGLPDLYDVSDTTNSSEGLGEWSLMASGNYNHFSKSPAHLDAWSKIKAGFVDPVLVASTGNIYRAEIPQVEDNPVIYLLQNTVASTSEYWLVENRQKTGLFDQYMASSGLCIYHIDNNQLVASPRYPNADPTRYGVGMEQADGKDDLSFTLANNGDPGDVWPGLSDNRNFHDLTEPGTKTYSSRSTAVGVWNISDPDSIMFADLDVGFSRPWVELNETNPFRFEDISNGVSNGLIEAGDTVTLFFTARNLMRPTYNARLSVDSDNEEILFIDNDAGLALFFNESFHTNPASDPIRFVMPDSVRPTTAPFRVTITADSLADGSGGTFSDEFVFFLSLGAPEILIVDDDRGETYEQYFSEALDNLRQPHAIYDKQASGSPTGLELSKYSIVIWHTGDLAPNVLSVADVNSMKEFLNNGGSLLLSSASAVQDIKNIDPQFMSDYLGCVPADSNKLWARVSGVSGTDLGGDSLVYNFRPQKFTTVEFLEPVGSGEAVYNLGDPFYHSSSFGTCGVVTSGSFKTVFATFPMEYINSSEPIWYSPLDTLLGRVIEFFGIGFTTAVNDERESKLLPKLFTLNQNYPNPFNPSTTISFTIKADGLTSQPIRTTLTVYNSLGQKVRTLIDKTLAAGEYRVDWDSRNSGGHKVSTGVYFYRLNRGELAQTRKMILLK